jgi:hypothetical protein
MLSPCCGIIWYADQTTAFSHSRGLPVLLFPHPAGGGGGMKNERLYFSATETQQV